jgi:hypothetical protein
MSPPLLHLHLHLLHLPPHLLHLHPHPPLEERTVERTEVERMEVERTAEVNCDERKFERDE